ncbi:urease accessory protein UreD, partial [Frankia sp. EI5c]|uniref:urease accessory protein UreD n=1 Tax=Frankia sp. EI5c TaxID=683316 RepID=UPI001F5B1353
HRMTTEIILAADASLRYREEILLGRFGEPGGRLETSLRVDVERAAPRRRPLLHQELHLGPDVPGVAGPAVLAGARAVGSVLIAGPAISPDPVGSSVGDGVALLPLAGAGVLVSALADGAVTLRRRLDSLAGPLIGSLGDAPAHHEGRPRT